MKLIVNGEEKNYDKVATIADLVDQLELDKTRIATELNLSVVPKKDYASTNLSDGDKLEIVTFVGGG